MEKNFLNLVGKSQSEAFEIIKSNGYTYGITMVDNNYSIVTMEFRFDRVSLEIVNGIVVSSTNS